MAETANTSDHSSQFYQSYWSEQRLGDVEHVSWKIRYLREQLGALRFDSILDVGGGDGRVLGGLGLTASRVAGTDVSPVAVEGLRQKGFEGAVVDLNRDALPFADASFDVVMCLDVLEHIFSPEKVASELARVVKPGGHVFLSVPNAFNVMNRLSFLRGDYVDHMDSAHREGDMFTEHIRLFSEAKLRECAAGAGLAVDRVDYYFPGQLSDPKFTQLESVAKVMRSLRLHERLPKWLALGFLARCSKR